MRRIRTTFTNREIPGRIANLQPFLSVVKLPDGTRVWSGLTGPAVWYGHLPRKYHDGVRQAAYVVYSYETPIAWMVEVDLPGDPCRYYLPDVSYSPTTGQHQYAVRDAWSDNLRRQGVYPSLGHGRGREVVRVPGNAVVYGRERRLRSGGMDGARPGEGLDGGAPVDQYNYSYPGGGQYQQMGPPVGDARGRSHP